MAPKAKSSKPVSSSRDLVPVGSRHLSSIHITGRHGKRDETGEKPSTARALVLRNGKHGARGTGELMVVNKLSGREKLDLLAEDLVERSKKAIGVPFRLEECRKISESQCDIFVDDIANLREPDLFRHLIEEELKARTKSIPNKPDRLKNPTYIAQIVGVRIHNAYMLASAWKIVKDTLRDLEMDGLTDQNCKVKLKVDQNIRDRYLFLFEMVNVLVNISQARFSVLATTAPHYASYFKQTEGSDPNEPEFVFDWGNRLRQATLSFLDSIIIELCFPHEMYPKAILYQLLRDAVEESPKEAKRFPQALWNAVGDLSETVHLLQLIEAPLLGPEGEALKNLPRRLPEEYERWMDAQLYSEKASSQVANFKDMISPLEKTSNHVVLENMWKFINLNYKSASGQNIDELWQLEDALDITPQWSSFFMPNIGIDSDSDSDGPPGLTSIKGKGKQNKRLTIAHYQDDDTSGDSMPGLQSVSNSSDEEETDYESDSDVESDDDESDESGYDTEQEDEIRDLLREAMDTAYEADWFDATNIPAEIDPFLQEDRKGNPFLKLLGSLRGRMFSSNPKLRTAMRTGEPTVPKPGGAGPKPAPSTGAQPESRKVTIEDVEDEDEAPRTPKKKKKKPKKKKKTSSTDSQQDTPPPLATPAPPEPAPRPTGQSSAAPPAAVSSSAKQVPKKAPISPRSSAVPPNMSTTSLSSFVTGTSVAQSARSYLQENGPQEKSKIKTRADHASIFSTQEKVKKGFLPSLGIGKDKDPDAPAKRSWFKNLSKKTEEYMHQLLKPSTGEGKVSMKWEHFLKVMRDMGFKYDPGTAGSSVRFDPPNSADKPITFHKPHPDSTLTDNLVREYAKRLKRRYGWTEDDLLKHAT